uniref:Uncharacterized protein n=1 Tax=Noctiluca scintillans TaxID=2966 RepID=A0A7S1AZ99_NOCSC|mmetsp:Transcript_65916/g.174777  ORF Transcript_65916/g.174777 Transcript_65916/m.174777 type:complete len:123 (+) Transcript_65916:48-416(+)
MQTARMTWQRPRSLLHQVLRVSACVKTPTLVRRKITKWCTYSCGHALSRTIVTRLRRSKYARPSVTEVKPTLEKQLPLQKPSFVTMLRVEAIHLKANLRHSVEQMAASRMSGRKTSRDWNVH